MPLTISDQLLHEAGLTEREALTELACRLFDTGRLTLWAGAQRAGLTRVQFEEEMQRRKIAVNRPGLEDLADDLSALDRLRT